jgi:peptidoglycan/LPS O-acetylase OafA/YrhL
MQFQQPALYLAAGATGAWGLVALCRASWLQRPALQMLGRHSLWILAVHMPVLWLLRGALRAARWPEHWWLLTLSCVVLMGLLSMWRDRVELSRHAAH